MVQVKHLGVIAIDDIELIRPTRLNGKCCVCETRDDIQAFLERHGNVIMSWSKDSNCYRNAERLTLFASIVVTLKRRESEHVG